MPLVDIEYHPPCTYYADGDHRERSGYYLCDCKASRAWHKTVPVEPEQALQSALEAVYQSGKPWRTIDGDMQVSDRTWEDLVRVAVFTALGIGGDE